jgi:hypothetical protein
LTKSNQIEPAAGDGVAQRESATSVPSEVKWGFGADTLAASVAGEAAQGRAHKGIRTAGYDGNQVLTGVVEHGHGATGSILEAKVARDLFGAGGVHRIEAG